MPILLQLQKNTGERGWRVGGGGGGSVFASFFGWPEDREFVENYIMRFGEGIL